MLRFLSSGESHGQALLAVLDGFPAGMKVDIALLNKELEDRQKGYGRGKRQKIESDRAEIISGVRHGITTGAPVTLVVSNRDFENWQQIMSTLPVDEFDDKDSEAEKQKKVSAFRPGHADLAGIMKFHAPDIRDVIERASARETAARVAAGALCRQLLSGFGVQMAGHVIAVGPLASNLDSESISISDLLRRAENSDLYCADESMQQAMKEYIDRALADGDTVGGVVEVIAEGLPVGLGSYTQWDERLDGQLAQALMSIQAIKAVEIGDGVGCARLPGSQVHDALYPAPENSSLPFSRQTNHAGGVEGGVSNGARLRVRGYMKPIPTLRQGLPSLSFPGYEAQKAHYERSDVCAVPAAAVVAKAMVSFVLARALLQKFGSDSVDETGQALARHRLWCKDQGGGGKQAAPGDQASTETGKEN